MDIIEFGIPIDESTDSHNTENTEDVSTSDISESDDLHDVSDRNAERSDNPDSSEEVVEGALAKRTEEKEFCDCVEPKQSYFPDGKYYCLNCWGVWYH